MPAAAAPVAVRGQQAEAHDQRTGFEQGAAGQQASGSRAMQGVPCSGPPRVGGALHGAQHPVVRAAAAQVAGERLLGLLAARPRHARSSATAVITMPLVQ